MRLGICALGATSDDTGGQTYLTNFAKTLAAMNTNHSFVFFVSRGEGNFIPESENIRKVEIHSKKTLGRLWGEQMSLPRIAKKLDVDVLYFPNNFTSFHCPCPSVVAIRSMLYYHYPASIDPLRNFYRRIMTPLSARNASRIVAPSEDIKKDIVRYVGVDENKIQVIHHGVDTSLFSQHTGNDESKKVLDEVGVTKPFILYVSALWAYKNHDKLIRAFEQIIRYHKLPHQLVLVGRGVNAYADYERNLHTLVRELSLDNRVLFAGFLSHEKLRHLYQHCDVYAYPSSYESFGNPLFEAMAAGAPIVASNVHSFPEMAGDAALLVDPLDVSSFSQALHRVITDGDIRSRLVSAGKARVSDFSWTSCVQETITLLESALN